MNIKEKVLEVSKLLDELDTFEEEIPSKDQYYDYRLSDLYHLLENAKLNSKFCYRFCKELQLILKERREHKNNVEITKVYRAHKEKMISGIDNRKMFLSDIRKRAKLLNMPYNNRVYTEEELLEKIGSD